MSPNGVGKIASATVKNRTQTPLLSWIRDKLLAVDRCPDTPPPGVPGSDGKAQYQNPARFPNTQASRGLEMPKLPGGVNHRISEVYYYDRDGRRGVKPPPELYKVDQHGNKFNDIDGKALSVEDVEKAVVKGPSENFGLSGPPTPGDGFEWKRCLSEELETQKNDLQLKRLEKFDRYVSKP